MPDIRHEKMAQVLINYSLRVKAGQKLLISGAPIALPLIRECYVAESAATRMSTAWGKQ